MIPIALDPALLGRVQLGVLLLEGVTVKEDDAPLRETIATTARDFRERFGSGPSADVPGAAEARSLYKALGIDPTKNRPSNEALLRRVLKGEELYRVNTLVDALNLLSLRHQMPFGLYDLARIEPPVVLRKGGPGESYEGIRKGAVSVDGRPVLADAQGPFGNPTSDSLRTCITLETRTALVVAYAPAAYPSIRLDAVLTDSAATLTRFNGGTETGRSRIVA